MRTVSGAAILNQLKDAKLPNLNEQGFEVSFKLDWVLPRSTGTPPAVVIEIFADQTGERQKISEVHALYAVSSWRLARDLGEALFDEHELIKLKSKMQSQAFWDQHLKGPAQ